VEHVELIAFISGAAIAVAFALVLSIQRGLRADLDALARKVERKAEAQDAELEALHREVGEVSAHADDIGRRVVELAEQIALLARQQEQMLLLRDPDGGPYMQAVRAACSGASVEALMSSFGLSRSEAELVVTLHRPRADSDA